MAHDPDTSQQPPELRPRRTRGRTVPDAAPAPPPAADPAPLAIDRDVLRIVAAHYLTQQARFIPLGTVARFGRGEDGQPYVELPLAADQPPERIRMSGLPPTGAVVETALVRTPPGPTRAFHVLVCPAPTARAAKDGLDEAVLQYLIDEVGLAGVEHMAQQMVQGGLEAPLDPGPRRSSRRRH